jgi:hypothetical protein
MARPIANTMAAAMTTPKMIVMTDIRVRSYRR